MTDLGVLEIRITGDTSGLDHDLDRARGQAEGFGSKAGGAFAGAFKVGVAAAGVATAGFFAKAVMGASDLQEQLSKVGVVFGDQAKQVTAYADQMAKDFGLPKTQILDAASSIGLIGKASGLSQGEAAKMSTQMASLAADASSFYNVPLEEALQAIRSGLVGEAEPMRRFGVLLSAEAVEAEAAALGLQKLNGKYDEGAKAQARASLIMKGMSDAQGDLARTSDSFANRLRELQGRAVNFATDVGTKVLPGLLKLMDMGESLGGKLAPLADKVGTLGKAFVAAFSGEGVTSDGLVGQVEGVAVKVRAFVDGVVGFVQTNWPRIQEIVSEVLTTVGAVISGFVTVVTTIWQNFGTQILNVIQSAWTAIMNVVDAALTVIRGIVDVFAGIFTGDWGRVWEGIKAIFSGVWDAIKAILSLALDIVINVVSAAWEIVRAIFSEAWEGIKNLVSSGVDAVIGFIASIPGRIASFAGSAFDALVSGFRAAVNTIIRGWNAIQFRIPGFHIGPVGYDGFTLGLPDIPLLDNGGIVTRPTLAMLAGNSRPEAIIPLDQMGGMGGTTINVYGSVVTERQLVDLVNRHQASDRRHNPTPRPFGR